MSNTSVLGQRFAGPSADPPARPACCSADPWRTSSSVLSDLVSGRHRNSSSVAPLGRFSRRRQYPFLFRISQIRCAGGQTRGPAFLHRQSGKVPALVCLFAELRFVICKNRFNVVHPPIQALPPVVLPPPNGKHHCF